MTRILSSLLVVAFFGFVGAAAARATAVYDAGPDLANYLNSNPSPPNATNGVWSYGNTTTLGSITPFSSAQYSTGWVNNSALNGWWINGNFTPAVVSNVTNSPSPTSNYPPVAVPSHEILLHPDGNSSTYTVVQFTVPSTGIYEGAAQWSTATNAGNGVNTVISIGATTVNSGATFSGTSFQTSNGSFAPTFLTAGTNIDFAINNRGDFGSDATVFIGSVTLIPEPSSIALLGLGATALVAFGRSRVLSWRSAASKVKSSRHPKAIAAQIVLLFMVVALSCAGAQSASAAVIYDAGPDLVPYALAGTAGNWPAVNGAWSYGTVNVSTLTPDSSTFSAFPNSDFTHDIGGLGASPSSTLQGWQTTAVIPAVAVNTSSTTTVTTTCCGSYTPESMWLHPTVGPNTPGADVRWTAPSAGLVTVNASFLNTGGGVTNEFLLHDSTVLVNATTGTAILPMSFSVAAGDTIDFGVLSKDSQGGESTRFSGSIAFAAVPEPSAVALSVIGLAALGCTTGYRRRRS